MTPLRGLTGEAWRTARSQPRRSLLSSLSIAWGLATFVLMVAYGDSISVTVREGFYALGSKAIFLIPGQTVMGSGGYRAGSVIRFTVDDIDYLSQSIPRLGEISPEARAGNLNFAAGPRILRSTLTGVWPEYGEICEVRMAEGRWLNPGDQVNGARVVVLAADLKQRLFGDASAVGQTVQVAGQNFTVAGVMRKKVQRQADTVANDQAYTPLASFAAVADARYLADIALAPEGVVDRGQFIDQLRRALARRHRFHPTDPLALRVFDVRQELGERLEWATRGLKFLSLFIGLLTLTVGGVGITNIMLVSVIARTREIGMAKSVGARGSDIFWQFLGEALILCLAGGALGVALAYAVGWLVGPMPFWSAFAYQNTGAGEISLRISAVHVALAWFLLSVVALSSGLWPALRAASLDPAEALRYEYVLTRVGLPRSVPGGDFASCRLSHAIPLLVGGSTEPGCPRLFIRQVGQDAGRDGVLLLVCQFRDFCDSSSKQPRHRYPSYSDYM